MSRLSDTIQQYRQRLLSHERTAMASLDYAHKQTLALIEPQLNALFDKMTQAMQNGEGISKSWLYEQNRLQAITDYISNNIDHYAAMSQMQVAQLQQSGVQLGQHSALALLDASKPPGVAFSFGVPSPDAIAGMVGATQAGSPLSDLFNGFGQEAAQGAKTALISGVTLGYNPRQIAPMVQQALDVSRYRAQTIARTEMIRSYRDANTATFQANSDVVDQWRWTCDLSPRTCAACLAMDGTLMDTDETLDSHPNCRCTPVPVTKSWDDILGNAGIDATGIEDTNPASDMQTGEDWFSKQDAATQQSILGKSKYEAFSEGKFTLHDVVGHSHDPVWGDSIYERSLKDTLEAAGKAPATLEDALKTMQEGDMPPATLSEADTTAWIEGYLRNFVPDVPEVFDPYRAFEDHIAAEQAKLQAAADEAEKLALKKQKASEAAKKGAATKAAKKAALKAQQEAEQAAADAKAAAEAVKAFNALQGTVAEKAAYILEHGGNDWIKALSTTERDAIDAYTGSAYRTINRYLRGLMTKYEKMPPSYLSVMQTLQDALLKAKAPTDLQNLRGYGSSQLQAFKDALANKGVFVEKGFSSTTIKSKPDFPGFRVLINIPEGSPGAYIEPISTVPGEQEYLLPYGAQFEVIDAFTGGANNDLWTFIANYIGVAE